MQKEIKKKKERIESVGGSGGGDGSSATMAFRSCEKNLAKKTTLATSTTDTRMCLRSSAQDLR